MPALVMDVEGLEQESTVPPVEATARDGPAPSEAGRLLLFKMRAFFATSSQFWVLQGLTNLNLAAADRSLTGSLSRLWSFF